MKEKVYELIPLDCSRSIDDFYVNRDFKAEVYPSTCHHNRNITPLLLKTKYLLFLKPYQRMILYSQLPSLQDYLFFFQIS